MHNSMKEFLAIVAIQIAFAAIFAGAVYLGQKADARCIHPTLQRPVTPWAPVRSCTR